MKRYSINSGARVGLPLFLLVTLQAIAVNAQDRWTNTNGGIWDVGSNWADGTAPGSTESSLFDLPGNGGFYSVLWDDITGITQNQDMALTNGATVNFRSSSAVGNTFAHVLTGDLFLLGNATLQLGGSSNRFDLHADHVLISNGDLRVFSESFLFCRETQIGITQSTVSNVTVNGPGSRFDNLEDLVVGVNGSGLLSITNGGVVTSNRVIAGDETGASGTVSVSGNGSRLELQSAFIVGSEGDGNLFISSRGSVSNSAGILNDSAVVSGSGSVWNNERLQISGSLDVRDGGSVTAGGPGSSDGASVRNGGSVILDGPGSELISSTSFALSSGTVEISNGALLSTDNSQQTATMVLTTGQMSVTGAGSRVETFDTRIRQGASLSVSEGAEYSSSRLLSIENRAAVSGADSLLKTQSIAVATLDDMAAPANLSIVAGGRVEADVIFVGDTRDENFAGAISLFGDGATLDVGALRLGSDFAAAGPGTIQIGNDALVRVNDSTNIGIDGEINLQGGRLEFGEMTIDDFSRINAQSGSMSGNLFNNAFRSAAEVEIAGSQNVDMREVVLHNDGQLFGQANLGVSLENRGTVQVVGGERMMFVGSGNNHDNINMSGGMVLFAGQLENQVSGFIGGRGVLSAQEGIVNRGVMAFSAGITDVFGDVQNEAGARIVTTGNGTTTFFDDVVHNGDEIRTSVGSASVFLGEVSGAGDFTGTGAVFFEGDLRPGNSPALITFDGDVVLGASVRTFIEIAGIDPGEFDRLEIAGDLELAGELSLSLIDGSELSDGLMLEFLDIDQNLFGQFDGLAEGAFVDRLGGFDFFITYAAGDGNDVALFTSAIPEPGTTTLLLIASACFLCRRQKPASS